MKLLSYDKKRWKALNKKGFPGSSELFLYSSSDLMADLYMAEAESECQDNQDYREEIE